MALLRQDTFDRINGAIGTPSDGGSAWTTVLGTFTVASNLAAQTGATGVNIALLSSSSANVKAKVTLATTSNSGLVVRSDGTDQNFIRVRALVGPDQLTLYKIVAGVQTQIGGNVAVTYNGSSSVLEVWADSDDLVSVYLDGDLKMSSTISDVPDSTNHGIYIFNTTSRLDDFEIHDFSDSVQLLAPVSDISSGTWLTSSGSPAELWQMLDGEKSPDEDYCYTTSAGTMEVKFASGSAPAVITGHTLRYRLRGNGTCDALVKLKVGSTVLAQWTETNVPAVDTDYEHTLDSSPSFTISDYSDLRISVEAVP